MRRVVAVAGLLAVSGQALAQDSVAQSPGGNDALSAYDAQLARYTLDLVPVLSSWGTEFVIGPVLKSSRSIDAGFSTQKLVGAVLSPDVVEHVSIPSTPFSTWATRGAGVHPSENSAPSQINIGYFSRRFGVACADLGVGPTNIIGALIGWRDNVPDRLFVERYIAVSSRDSMAGQDHSTLSLGGIDAEGEVSLRADDFGISDLTPNKIIDENIVRVDIEQRNGSPNALHSSIGVNNANDPAATVFFVNKSTTSVAAPAGMPSTVSAAGEAAPITLDFAGAHHIGGEAPMTDHLDPAIDAHRGAPSYSTLGFAGGEGGAIGFLAIQDSGVSLAVDALAAAALDTQGNVVGTISAAIPSPLIDGLFSATNAVFIGHLSQSAFRGGSGPVALGGSMAGEFTLAASARGDAGTEFIAAATFDAPVGMSAASWSAPAFVGKAVLDGENGQQIGTLVAGSQVGSPVSFSSPAVDVLGNVYFVGVFKPTLQPARTAVCKAVNTGSGYQIEVLFQSGQIVVGANSTRPYLIQSIALGDADSIASGSIWSGSVLHSRRVGAGGNPAFADAFGGLVVSAVIEYDNLTQLERYDAVLFVGPKGIDGLVADINGDGVVDTADLGLLIAAFGTGDPQADLNGDGVVDTADLGLLISQFGDSE